MCTIHAILKYFKTQSHVFTTKLDLPRLDFPWSMLSWMGVYFFRQEDDEEVKTVLPLGSSFLLQPVTISWKLPISSSTGPAPPPPQTQCLSLGQEKRVRRFQLFPVIIAVMFTMWFSVCVISQIFNIEIFARGLSFSDSVLVLTSRTNTFSKYSSYLKGALNDWSFLSSYTCMYEMQHGQVAIPKD